MGIEFMGNTVPEQFFASEYKSVYITYAHSSTQFPQFLLIIIPRSIGLYITFYMKLLIKLFKENALFKSPTTGVLHGIDIPPFSNDAVFDDTRVADEGVDTITCHHRDRVTVTHSRCSMVFWLLAGPCPHRQQQGKHSARPDVGRMVFSLKYQFTSVVCLLYVLRQTYSTFHLANHFSLKVMPRLMRKVFSVIRLVADCLAHWTLMLRTERLPHLLTNGMPIPALTLSSFGPSCPFTL